MIGQAIRQYHILEKLGEGGRGVVYLAEDTRLKREVAIKFLPPHLAAGAREQERLLLEAQASAALSHPNVATIYTIEENQGEWFIVMEYVQGESLQQLLSREQRQLPLAQVLDYAAQIAAGLQAAHVRGIVHRDLKPANIMITPAGRVPIINDWLNETLGPVTLR